jgi:acyl-CoA synthetase (AMP-forming)/AMP-acid ligase II
MQRDPQSVVDILASRAQATPDALAYGFLASGEREEARLTWRELDRQSRAIAAAIAARVESRGARVLLLFPPGLDFIPAFFGCLAAGAIALPAYPPSSHRRDRTIARLRGMVADAGVSLVVAAESVRERRAALEELIPELAHLAWVTPSEIDRDAHGDRTISGPRGTDVALLQYTSGSTSSPRGVVVTHANLLDNLAHGARLGGCDPTCIGVSWLPVNHDMGLIGGVLQPAFSGFPMWLMAPAAFLQRPTRWLHAISRFGATHSAAPNFAYELCARRVPAAERASLDLSTWRVAYNAAEPIRMSTLDAFQRAFGECGFHWESFRPAYGLAESTLLVTSATDITAGPAALNIDRESAGLGRVVMDADDGERMTVVGCGSTANGVRIAIVDPVRRVRCAPDHIGEIWIASASVARGYWNRPEETAATFGARLGDEGPFLRTGDLGFLHDGRLFVTGRLKDVLIVRGHKHYPQDLELTVEQASNVVRPGCCAAVAIHAAGADERVAIVAEVDARADRAGHDADVHALSQQAIADIRRAIHEVHGLPVCGIVFVPAGSLPRTTSGKLQRFLCRDAFVAGDLDALCHWVAPGMPSPVALRRAS